MAKIFALKAFNYNTIDLNLPIRTGYDGSFENNVNHYYRGSVYEDIGVIYYRDYSAPSAVGFAGFNFAFSGANNMNAISGTVTAYFKSERIFGSNTWIDNWGIQDFSVSLISMEQAMRSSSTLDDQIIFNQIFNGNDQFDLSNDNDIARGHSGNDRLLGNGGNDFLYGDDGNDYLSGGVGSDVLDGGSGIDIAVFIGNKAQYHINRSGSRVVDTVNSRDGEDVIGNVERLMFKDVNVALDINLWDNAGSAYRLYKAAFDRAPDETGLGYWIDVLDDSGSLQLAASGFINSAEFQSLYGANPSDTLFITKLYNNVLDREPDQGGLNYWIGQLNNGMSRESALINFSESNENVSNVAALIENGIQYQPWLL